MTRYFLICSLFLISACVNAEDYLQQMSNELEFKLEWANYGDGKTLSFEYCPTNRCDLFVARSPDLYKFLKFIDLYILYASHYGDLAKISDKGAPPIDYIKNRINKVQFKNVVSGDCSKKANIEALSCTLNSYADDLKLAKFNVSYDEGQRAEVEDTKWKDKELSKDSIRSSLEWFEKFGQNQGVRLLDFRVTEKSRGQTP